MAGPRKGLRHAQTYIVLGEQVERAEHLIILDVKRPCCLELSSEVQFQSCLYGGLLLHLQSPYLLLLVAVMVPRGPCGPS